MTEADWLNATTAAEVFAFACSHATERQYRLFLCGLARSVWHLVYYEGSRESVEVAERYVDGAATRGELRGAAWVAEIPTFGHDFDGTWRRFEPDAIPARILRLVELGVLSEVGPNALDEVVDEIALTHVSVAACVAEYSSCDFTQNNAGNVARMVRRSPRLFPAQIIRCVLGNPHRHATLTAEWRTEAVVALSRGMYESRDFAAMPVLADALDDAGCDHPDILDHCRSDGPHIRGCWVVDSVLGKR
jgi:hypothetical protein